MGSTFGGISVANSALAAQRRAIETAGHNVANANTPGYTRQRVDLGARSGGAVSTHAGTFYAGAGVDVLSQSRIIDQFLVNRANDEGAALGLHSERSQALSRIELAFGEPGPDGLEAQLEAYWSAWDTVALTPEDEAARTSLLQRTNAITGQLQSLSQQFDALASNTVQRAKAVTVDINAITSRIADLNVAIATSVGAGVAPNDLLDQRDSLVQTLSGYVGVTTRVDELNQMSVNIGGVSLVSGRRAQAISLDTSVPGGAVLRVEGATQPLGSNSGQIQGMLDTINVILPNQQAKLDAFAVQLRDVVNTQHALGRDMDGVTGAAFFEGTSARDLRLSTAVAGNPRAIAAAAAGEGAFGGTNALRLAELASLDIGPDATYRAMIADMGVQAQSSNQRLTLQENLARSVASQRDQVSGVSIDEEMAMLVAYQQSYDASARVLTAIDEMLDRLINGTGAVGR